MQNRLDEATQLLRERLLAGRDGEGGERLREQGLAEALTVSRTIVRLALGELEKEGLVERIPNRGFFIRTITLSDVVDAIAVRGELEGMAARLCAENGLDGETLAELARLNRTMATLINRGVGTVDERMEWINHNSAFHSCLLEACGNRFIRETVEGLSKLPLVGAHAIVFDQSGNENDIARLRHALDDHEAVVDAIEHCQGSRASSIMTEHALASAKNKYASFDAMQNQRHGLEVRGLRLVKR